MRAASRRALLPPAFPARCGSPRPFLGAWLRAKLGEYVGVPQKDAQLAALKAEADAAAQQLGDLQARSDGNYDVWERGLTRRLPKQEELARARGEGVALHRRLAAAKAERETVVVGRAEAVATAERRARAAEAASSQLHAVLRSIVRIAGAGADRAVTGGGVEREALPAAQAQPQLSASSTASAQPPEADAEEAAPVGVQLRSRAAAAAAAPRWVKRLNASPAFPVSLGACP